ncbi:efflux RND transporter permease subunit [Sedimenticola selenatireducens]|uniref:Efflux RND transporter permease subunit n=1 Tax=Sedimenticola selenatireducens TaxID=191960 RepID=A0A557S1F8_9GAMM|nr:efflux RND transporter permease subunit [Sedimenticola selenatireducens]TVO71207.1 efflux RND transporter permease subunit [Sedimenticola selenatireducens]TVT61509.1 MAG: efflux RND transporter permease subunit [Sedimenticola selenatireducens]
MIRFFAAHPTIGNILMMAIIAMGLVSVGGLNKESFPLLKPSKVQVTVAYPGASPADVEDGICNPLEDATDGISFLIEQECDARDNIAIVTLEMHETGDIRQFTDDVRSAVDGISNFPENSEEPIITQLGRINPVANIAITSDNLTHSELKALAEFYRDRLVAMPEIPIVTIDGFSTHQLQVRLRPDTLKKYNLSAESVAGLIASQALELPAGLVEATETSYQIRFDNLRKSIDELADLVVINTRDGGEIKLGDIAVLEDRFDKPEERIELNGKPAALLKVSKNTIDDTLKVADALLQFVERENSILPPSTRLTVMNDNSTSVRDRLKLLLTNSWQGLLLATTMLLLFFSWRYTLWIALGLPVSFLGGVALMSMFGISINMISMVALLMAIGILMDDAIVLSENIDHEYRKGKKPLEAAIDGTKKVVRGVFSSFLTSAFLFGSLLMMKGDMGQILGVLPVVLLSVLTISLIEAFLILPHHLKHSLEHGHDKTPPKWRLVFEAQFDRLRHAISRAAKGAMAFRYLTVGAALSALILSVGLIATGTVKFKAFPDLEGNNVEARVLLSQGTPLEKTEQVVTTLLGALDKTNLQLSELESETLVKNIQVSYGEHGDVPETGPHLATLSVDILTTEQRHTTMAGLIRSWKENAGVLPDVLNIQYKEPKVGAAGRAIHIRLGGDDLKQLSRASWDLQNWLRGYAGVTNLLDDLRPGLPQYSIRLKPGALAKGIDSRSIASQLRSAYLEAKISEIYRGRESYEIVARLDSPKQQALRDFDDFTVFSKSGEALPLSSVATITETRDFSRIGHVNHLRTVNIYGDVDADVANTSEVIANLQDSFLETLLARYPGVAVTFKGEVENGTETKLSILSGFGLGAFAVFLLLSLQFGNYREPLIVMITIPLALIGSIWGHFIMGLDFTLPSMIGFVSLAGIVVNDSILLVEFIKYRVAEGSSFHRAAQQAVFDRSRAIFLTSVTTVAGMTPLLFETSSQALILVPLVTSIVFGMLTSTVLIMLVLPAMYAIMEDVGFVNMSVPVSD